MGICQGLLQEFHKALLRDRQVTIILVTLDLLSHDAWKKFQNILQMVVKNNSDCP